MHPATSWRLVIPVKQAHLAKTRLSLPEGPDRTILARAIACDTIEAAAGAIRPDSIAVVTSDDQVAPWAAELGAVVVPDPGGGLNAAVSAGLAHWAAAGAAQPPPTPPIRYAPSVAVLLGDVPAMRSVDLATGLAAAGAHRLAVIPDHEGTGTVLLTASAGAGPEDLRPAFGQDSAAAHEAMGAVRLDLDLPRLRTDADTNAALTVIRALGAGPRTRMALAAAC